MLPTPTAMPVVSEPIITISSDSFRIWEFTDEAVQIWNHQPNFGLMIQWGIIIAIVATFVVLMIHLLQKTMDQE